jgi:excisionase family DNA binding protein
MTVPEVAAFVRCSVQVAYRWTRTGKLPVVRIGRLVRVDREALEALIRDNTIAPKGLIND